MNLLKTIWNYHFAKWEINVGDVFVVDVEDPFNNAPQHIVQEVKNGWAKLDWYRPGNTLNIPPDARKVELRMLRAYYLRIKEA